MLKLKTICFVFLLALSSVVSTTLAQPKSNKEATESLMEQMERERLELQQATQDAQDQLMRVADPTASNSDSLVPFFKIDEMLAPYRSQSPEITKEHLRTKLKGKPIVSSPKFIDFLDDLIRDDQALQKVGDIINNKKKLFAFFIFNVLLFFIGFIFKKLHREKNLVSGPGMRGVRLIWRLSCMFAIRLVVIMYFFGANLAPTFNLVKKNFF